MKISKIRLDFSKEMVLASTHNLFLSKHNAFSCKRDTQQGLDLLNMKKMKKQQHKNNTKNNNTKKQDSPFGDIFEFLGHDTVNTSPVLVSWK